jgi:hypothetical protein
MTLVSDEKQHNFILFDTVLHCSNTYQSHNIMIMMVNALNIARRRCSLLQALPSPYRLETSSYDQRCEQDSAGWFTAVQHQRVLQEGDDLAERV